MKKEHSFKEVCKKIVNSKTYEILNNYQCFEMIQKVIDNHRFCSCDFFDFVCFFRNAIVVRIIKDQKEFVINDINPNQIFFIDNNFKSFSSTKNKQKEYIDKYNLVDFDIIAEAFEENLDDFVILLYKEQDENEYQEVRKLLYEVNNH